MPSYLKGHFRSPDPHFSLTSYTPKTHSQKYINSSIGAPTKSYNLCVWVIKPVLFSLNYD